ncbi:uncharacterized protein LOC127557645 [Antechinus flavipes]|uniref:uncharacterized protein LOC127557645 n=1 Tax=Antechinus flavipes TaxID=38775 RepID=UPI0022359D03|nr:uncharacterized protein LOC127557645 [Antechinus flavipes]
MKGPPERRFIVPMFSRPQRRKLFQSRAANGSELPIVEGSPLCAAAGGPGDNSLATSAPNRGHPGSLPPAPNGEQGNRKVVKEKGKGDQGKAESSPWLNAGHVSLEGECPQLLALENPASKAVQGRLVPLWPEALPGSTPGPREGHLAKDGPGLGGQEVGENGRRPPASLTEDKQLGEGLHLALPPSPSREVGQQKGSRTPNTRFSDMDKGVRTCPKLSGGKKLPATTGRKAALPRGKRPETHPEAGQEAWIKDLDSLRRRMLQEIPELQALGKQEDVAASVPTRQGIAMIQERLAAPAGASTIAPVALRLPPLLCLSWKVKKPKGLRAPNDSTDQMDGGSQLPRKCSPEKKPPGRSAQAGHKTALPGRTREKRPSPEFWIKDLDTLRRRMLQEIPELQTLGKKKEILPAAVRTPQGITEIQEHLATPAGALQTATGALRFPPLPSPFREVEQAKGLGATKVSVIQVDKGMQVQGKLCPDEGPNDCGAETEEEGAVPRKKRKKDHPGPRQENRKKLRSSVSTHGLEPDKKDKLSGQSKIQDRQSTTEISDRLEAPGGASAIAPVALRLPPLLSLSRKVEEPKGLVAPKDSTDQRDRGSRLPRKCSPEKKRPGRSAQPGQKTVLPDRTSQTPASPGFWIKDLDTLRRLMLEAMPELHALGKKKGDVAPEFLSRQGITEIQEHLAASAGGLQTAPEALRLSPLPSPFREVPSTLGRRIPESVQELHALGKPGHRSAGSLRAPRSPARAHVRLPAPAAVSETALQPLCFSTGHFPSRGVEQPKDIGNTMARGVQADRGLRGPPKPWPGRELSESGAEPQEEAVPLTNKRKRGLPEPTPEVWKKLRTFLSANMPKAPQKKDKLAGSVGVPRSPPKVQERGGTPAEGPAPRQSQAGLRAPARDTTHKAYEKPAQPIPTAPPLKVVGALLPPAPWRQWSPEREGLKRKAQQERELAAKYTALGKRNFFEERQKDMDIARYYGYMV